MKALTLIVLSLLMILMACDTVKPYVDIDLMMSQRLNWDQFIQTDANLNGNLDQMIDPFRACKLDDDCLAHQYCRYDFQQQSIDLAFIQSNTNTPSSELSGTCALVLDIQKLKSNTGFAVYAKSFDLLPKTKIYESWTANETCTSYRRKNHHYHGLLKKNPVINDFICLDHFDDQDQDGVFDALWLAGDELGRAASGEDTFLPEGRLLIWQDQNQEIFALIILDVFAIDRLTQIRFSQAIARRTGILFNHIFWHATGNLNAPDLTGFFGPTLEQTEFLFSDEKEKDPDLNLISSLAMMSGRDEALSLFILDQITLKIENLIESPQLLKPARLKVQMIENPFAYELPIFSTRPDLGFAIPDNNDDADYNDAEDFHYFYDAQKLYFERKSFPYVIDPSLRVMQWIETPENTQSTSAAASKSDMLINMASNNGNATDFQVDQLTDQSVDQSPIDHDSEKVIATIFSMGFRDPVHEKDYLSSGVIGQTRALIELSTAAPAIFMTFSASDDIVFSQKVPNLKSDGSILNSIYDLSPTPTQTFAQGLSSIILQSLQNENRFQKNPIIIDPKAVVESKSIWLPLSNPRFDLAFALSNQSDQSDQSNQSNQQINQFIKQDESQKTYLLHELHRISWLDLSQENDIPKVNWFFIPANLDSAITSGQGLSLKLSPKLRIYEDIDGDSILDDVDLEIKYEAMVNQEETVKVLNMINPQSFPTLDPLNQPENWLISNVNGGFGTMYLKKSTVDIFEGKDQALIDQMQILSNQYEQLLDLFMPFDRFHPSAKTQKQLFLLNPNQILNWLNLHAKDWVNLKNHHELIFDRTRLKRTQVTDNINQSEELINQIEERLEYALANSYLNDLVLPSNTWQIIRKYEGMEEVLFQGKDHLIIDQVDEQFKIYSLASNFYEKRIDGNHTYLRFEYGNQPILIFEVPIISHGKLLLSKYPNALKSWNSPFYQSGGLVYSILCDWIYLTNCQGIDDF